MHKWVIITELSKCNNGEFTGFYESWEKEEIEFLGALFFFNHFESQL